MKENKSYTHLNFLFPLGYVMLIGLFWAKDSKYVSCYSSWANTELYQKRYFIEECPCFVVRQLGLLVKHTVYVVSNADQPYVFPQIILILLRGFRLGHVGAV